MNWLDKLISRILTLFPAIWLITPDRGGIRITPKPLGGVWVRRLSPGYWFYWPLLQVIQDLPVVTQTVDLKSQSAFTKDSQSVCVSGTLRYSVADPIKALLGVHDVDEALQNVALITIFKYIGQTTLADICAAPERIQAAMERELRRIGKTWGVVIEDVGLSDFGVAHNIRLLTSEALVSLTTGG